ncbi:hypothetical protein MMIC_P0425 [Mariprofundus micogutta]|uniref:Porin n=1 Tax=Mariprofundus micogutta TaxID=1921010 RepID=A0A1L8CKR2_9PROT|nr:hypothetical protein [Mariprofundus micogutta]GAV19491.1 hypothetical protein MMIC_P0425 [Mariprofundus micogutta]
MRNTIKTVAAAAMLAFATPAMAGGVTVAEDGDSKLKLEALLYLNSYSQKADTITAAGTTTTKTAGLAVDRAYFTAKYFFNEDWMMRITLDAGNDQSLAGKKQNVFLKAAYVEGKLLGDAAVLRVGQSHTPWIDYEQGLWKHRYASQVMTDRYKFDDSFDLGLGLKGTLADGMIKYFITETNGSGYANARRTARIDLNARIGIYPVEGLTLDFQFRDGNRGTRTSVTKGIKTTLMQAMVSYGTSDFRIGGNYIANKDKANGATTVSIHHGGAVSSGYNFNTLVAGDQVKSNAYGLWAWAKLPANFGVFGRFENMNNKLNGGVTKEKMTRFMGGIEYTEIKGVRFALVADSNKLTNRGGVTANSRKDIRFGLYSEVKL